MKKADLASPTTAMHLFTALVKQGKSVGAMDLDLRQQSFFRYAEIRASYAEREGMEMALPEMIKLKNSVLKNRDEALDEEERLFGAALEELQDGNDFILIDCPGTHSYFSQLAHASADTLVTPMNDSLIDFDLLARVDPATHSVLGPSVYSEMVWKARQLRSRAGLKPIDWIVTRNRMSNLHAKNKRKVGTLLEDLAKRIGFRIAPGFSERVIFREMFLNGLTLLDLKGGALSLSHVAARQEVRELLKELNLPGVAASV